jgi:DNA-binding NtrC family response regulator
VAHRLLAANGRDEQRSGDAMNHRLLVIEEPCTPADASVCSVLTNDDGFACRTVDWGAITPERVDWRDTDAVVAVAVPLTDKASGFLEWLGRQHVDAPTFAVLPTAANDALLRMTSEATDDFIVSPVRHNELRYRLRRLLGPRRPDVDAVRRRLTEEMGLSQLVGNAPAFVKVVEQIQVIARSDVAVLITGETGTGKELCAQAIHHLSRRRPFPFIAVDCATVPDHLFENELFGHARGAFTDAHRDQKGLIAMAEGGTLFLDEVDALSLPAQGKLLRFLQERAFRPLGGERFIRADVNVMAASNHDLDACVHDKQFRADLYFRLNMLRVHLPPLRERPGDVALLAAHFLERLTPPDATRRRTFSFANLRKLSSYRWPGNVRELFNVVQRAVVMSGDRQIIPLELAPDKGPDGMVSTQNFRAARADAVATFEREYVQQLLRKHDGNVTRAAREAQKERRAFGRLVKKYGIERRLLP